MYHLNEGDTPLVAVGYVVSKHFLLVMLPTEQVWSIYSQEKYSLSQCYKFYIN